MSNPINPMLAISTYPLAIGAFLRPVESDEKTFEKYAALTATEVCHLLGTAIGAIETVFWGTIFLLAKAVQTLMPQSFETASDICDWTFGRAGYSLLTTAVSGVSAVYTFFANEQEIAQIEDSVIAMLHLESIQESIH